MISLADHPRAAAGVRRAKAWAGLVAFFVTGIGSYLSGMALDGSAFRALAAGVVAYMVVWALAIGVWRAYLRAETRSAVDRALARRQAQIEARAQASRQ
jgi:high-affinity Fe2+/Pb2+ permease